MLLNSKTKWLYMISVKFGPMVQKLCQVYCIIFLLLRRVAIRNIFHLFIPLNTGITNWKYQMSKVTLHLEFNQNQSKMCIFFFFLNGKYKVQLWTSKILTDNYWWSWIKKSSVKRFCLFTSAVSVSCKKICLKLSLA